jgi:sugar lactone lactonase YvrE
MHQKAGWTRGQCPLISTFGHEAPAAVNASTGSALASSTASAKSLPANPMERKAIAIVPASAPGPKIATNSSAQTSELTERDATRISLANSLTIRMGTMLLAAISPIGTVTHSAAAATAWPRCRPANTGFVTEVQIVDRWNVQAHDHDRPHGATILVAWRDEGKFQMAYSRLLISAGLAALLPAAVAGAGTELWSLDGFSNPESVAWDVEREVLYVSNVAGEPLERNGEGFLSIVSLDGEMIRQDWVTGLNAPKGIAVDGPTLYVTDIDRLVAIDIESGTVAGTWQGQDAIFLNDPAVGEDGRVFVSDMLRHAIYVLDGDSFTMWMEDEALQHPNGLKVEDARLIVAPWGQDMQEDFTTLVGGHLVTVNLENREIAPLGTGEPVGNLDGLEPDGEGNWLVTDWIAGRLLRISPDGGYEELLDLPMGSADLEYVPGQRLAIIPLMLDGRVVAYSLE